MIRSPCKGCDNELKSKKKCLKRCRTLHGIQKYSAIFNEEAYTDQDYIIEEGMVIIDVSCLSDDEQ